MQPEGPEAQQEGLGVRPEGAEGHQEGLVGILQVLWPHLGAPSRRQLRLTCSATRVCGEFSPSSATAMLLLLPGLTRD